MSERKLDELKYRCASCGREVDGDPPPDRCYPCTYESSGRHEEPISRKLGRLREVRARKVAGPDVGDLLADEVLGMLFNRVMVLEGELAKATDLLSAMSTRGSGES